MIPQNHKNPLSNIISKNNFNTIFEGIKQGLRLDGRLATQSRNISIKVLESGHSMVSNGKGMVMCGITASVAPPLTTRKNEGTFHVDVVFSPCANPELSGHLSTKSLSVSNISSALEAAINDSSALQLEGLCIAENSHVWHIQATITILADDGGILTISSISLAHALQNFRLPSVKFVGSTFSIDPDFTSPLPLQYIPIAIQYIFVSLADLEESINKFSQKLEESGDLIDHNELLQNFLDENTLIFIDPTSQEEGISSGLMTVFVTSNGEICSVSKYSGAALRTESFMSLIKHSLSQTNSYFSVIGQLESLQSLVAKEVSLVSKSTLGSDSLAAGIEQL